MTMKITFYMAPMSSATPVDSALRELAVPHETVRIDLKSGDQKKPEFLALNPNGKVPTMVIDGAPMHEALAIMHFLGDRFGVEKGLWPRADSAERRTATTWSTWAYVTLQPMVLLLNVAGGPHTPAALHHPPLVEFALSELRQRLGALEAHLADRPFILGESYSLADLIVASTLLWARMCGAPVAEFPRVQALAQRVSDRPAVRASWQPA